MTLARTILALVVLIGLHSTLSADVVQLADGRSFTGEIIDRTDSSVTIRTIVASIPVTFRLTIGAEDRIIEKKVPRDFFTPKKVATVAGPEGEAPAGAEHQYLELPIQGRIGEEIVADGVRRGFDYALRKHVKHIIFTIDCAGGSYTEASAISQVLKRYAPHLDYHAVIQNAEGIAMAVPIWCDTIHIRPDAKLGGVNTDADARRTDEQGREVTDDALVAAAAAVAEKRGIPGLVIAAMVIPEETIEAWRDDAGEIQIAHSLPEESAVAKSIFRSDQRTRLTLTGVQAAEVGIAKIFEGELGSLGKQLQDAGWTAESDFGVRVMKTAAREAAADRKKVVRAVGNWNEDIDENVLKHKETVSYILASLAEFGEVDPRKGDFSTIKVDTGNYDWYGRYHYRPRDTHQFTKDSKRQWKVQSDQALRALDRVRKGIGQLEKLDKKAKKLGIVRDSAAELGQYVTLQGEEHQLELKVLEQRVVSEMNRVAKERNREGN